MAGITLNGDEEFDIKVNNEKAFALIVAYGVNGFGECFIENYLDSRDLEKTLNILFECKFTPLACRLDIWTTLEELINQTFDIQTIENSWKDGGEHYDKFTDAIETISGPLSAYSCLNFNNTNDLAEAEAAQLKLCATKLKLKPGMEVLDIGCGFGTYAEYLVKNYDVSVTGVTISKEMAQRAQERCEKLNVNIINCDYRQIPAAKYDRIICIEMIEHIGDQHYSEFFRIVHSLLKEDGIFLLQVASNNQPYIFEYMPLFAKVFAMRITMPRIQKTIQKACDYFVIEHLQNQGYNYGLTLSAAYANLKVYEEMLKEKYGNKLFRVLYLYTAGGAAFKNRFLHNFQIVFSKNGLKYNYTTK